MSNCTKCNLKLKRAMLVQEIRDAANDRQAINDRLDLVQYLLGVLDRQTMPRVECPEKFYSGCPFLDLFIEQMRRQRIEQKSDTRRVSEVSADTGTEREN